MDTFYLKIMFLFLRIAINFVPREEYTEKLRAIESRNLPISKESLHGWQYRNIRSETIGLTHSYFEYPSPNDSGPLFLMLHGLVLDGRTFIKMSKLSEYGRLIAYNLPERTDLYNGDINNYNLILGDFLKSQDLSNGVVFCGVSAGGGLAVHLAASRDIPDPSHLILISTQLNGESVLKDRRKFADWVRDKKDYQLVWLMEKIMANYEKGLSPAERDTLDEILYIKHPDYYRQIVNSQSDHNGLAQARAITCPTLILRGEKDNIISGEAAAKMKEAIAAAEVQTIPNASHVMAVMQGDDVAERIAGFCGNHILLATPDH